MKNKCLFLFWLSVLLLSSIAHGETLTLDGFVRKVWENNRDLRAEKLSVDAAGLAVREKESIYDPVLKADISQRDTELGQRNGTDTLSSSISLSKNLSSGADIALSAASSRTGEPATPYGSQLALSYTQPLLRGAGQENNEYQINSARLDNEVAHENYRNYQNTILTEIVSAYCNYFISYQNREILRKNLEYTKQILGINQKKEKLNLATPYDVMESEIELKKITDEILALDSSVDKQADELLRLMGLDPLSSGARSFIPANPGLPQSAMVATASGLSTNNPSLRASRATLKKLTLTVGYYTNQLLPDLAFNSSLVVAKDSDSFANSLAVSDTSYSMGLSFSYPLGSTRSKLLLDQQKLGIEQQQARLEDLEQTVRILAVSLTRDLAVMAKRVSTAEDLVKLSEQFLAGQMKKYELGLLSTDKILQDQASLKNAQLQYYQHIVTYLKTYYQLLALQGDLPSVFGLQPKEK